MRTWLAAALVLVLVLAAGALALLAATGPGDREVPPFPEVTIERDEPDPLEFEPGSEPDLTARAAAGHSHVVYALSPGGVHATARRVVRYRAKIERVARSAGVDPDLVEAMVFLESAGRPEVAASDDLEGAVGLGQILAGTATALLGMRVDVQASERLTRKIRRADARGRSARARRLRAARRRVDERFDPDKSLEGTGRYLRTARARFGREDLAVVSYHMGIANLTGVLDAYGRRRPSWTRVYFDATPDRHPRTFRLLSELSDQSASYLWRVLASKEIMRLWREDRPELARLDALHRAKASAEEVLHPRSETEVFAGPDQVAEAYEEGRLERFPDAPRRLGLRRDRRMGELVRKERWLYRGLRPEAFALAAYLAAKVRELSGARAPLIVTSTVRDERYQRRLTRRNLEATRAYSLHTTGFAFDIRRRYASRRQAAALQTMLDRLQSLNLIAWVREPGAIHITVSGEARRLLPLLD
ncbi:MAG TPA: DUF5715 family protein [Thermoleophilaceae bacterium]|nr:DUF5715 family protein [Thermoleophilaceae bacterium]